MRTATQKASRRTRTAERKHQGPERAFALRDGWEIGRAQGQCLEEPHRLRPQLAHETRQNGPVVTGTQRMFVAWHLHLQVLKKFVATFLLDYMYMYT